MSLDRDDLMVIGNGFIAIAKALTPDPTWPDAKCHECGWWWHETEKTDDGRLQLADCICLKFDHDNEPNCAACPAFVRRPQAPAAKDGE